MNLQLVVTLVALSTACFTAGCAPARTANAENDREDRVAIQETRCQTEGPLTLLPDEKGRFPLINLDIRTDQTCILVVPLDAGEVRSAVAGKKIFDYRRIHPIDAFSHILFFNTTTQSLAAIADVKGTLAGAPKEILKQTLKHSGKNLNSGRTYFAGRAYGFATEITNVRLLAKPITLREAKQLDPNFQRPFGYFFLDRHPVVEGAVLSQLEASAPSK